MRYWQEGNLLLKEHIGETFNTFLNATITPKLIAEEARYHFKQLKKFGMCIVSFATELDQDLKEFDPYDVDLVLGYSATRYVKNIRPLNKPKARQSLNPDKVREFIIKPLHEYLAWCAEESPEYHLVDIYTRDQYSWDESSGVVFLHDIDPLIYFNNAKSRKENLDYISEEFSDVL
jgi:hypothetical protein